MKCISPPLNQGWPCDLLCQQNLVEMAVAASEHWPQKIFCTHLPWHSVLYQCHQTQACLLENERRSEPEPGKPGFLRQDHQTWIFDNFKFGWNDCSQKGQAHWQTTGKKLLGGIPSAVEGYSSFIIDAFILFPSHSLSHDHGVPITCQVPGWQCCVDNRFTTSLPN